MNEEHAEKRGAIQRISRGLLDRRLEAPHVSEIADEMLRRFGSVERFTLDWKRQLDRAAADPKTNLKTVLDGYKSMFMIFAESTKYRSTAPDVSGLSDEEIANELRQAALAAVRENPDALVELADELGLALVRKDDPRIIQAEAVSTEPVNGTLDGA
jgi:hypothetical protein